MSLILASTSPIRARLLREAGYAFGVIAPVCDEEALKAEYGDCSPLQLAQALAIAKARSVSRLYPDAWVIGADQVCELHGEILGKAGTREKAVAQLRRLSGREHCQHSAAALCYAGEVRWQGVATTRLRMRSLDALQIREYVARDNPVSAAGSYLFEENGHRLFSHVEGEKSTILGLPLETLRVALEKR